MPGIVLVLVLFLMYSFNKYLLSILCASFWILAISQHNSNIEHLEINTAWLHEDYMSLGKIRIKIFYKDKEQKMTKGNGH